MIHSLTTYIKTIAIGAIAGVAVTSCTSDLDSPAIDNTNQDGFGIGFRCTEMVETFYGFHNPATRASENKTTEEKEIKSIHIFFFDYADPDKGEGPEEKLLEPADYNNFTSYIYKEKGDKVDPSFIPIPYKSETEVKLFKDQPADGRVRVVAIANIDAIDNGVNLFKTCYDGNPQGEIREEGRTDQKFNNGGENPILTIKNYSDLQNWIYFPPIRMGDDGVSGNISTLPESGMPMIGEAIIDIRTKPDVNPVIPMRALMAKVNVSVELDPDQFTSQYPLLTITEYGVRNMPIAVPFVMPTGELKENKQKPGRDYSYKDYIDTYDVTQVPVYHLTGVSDLPEDPFHEVCEDAAHEFTTKVNVTLNKDSEAYTFSYYTFENINLPNYAAKRADDTYAFDENQDPIYPSGVKPADKQRWKSTFAYSDRASALILKGRYTTHQGISYNAEFSFYMGGDTDIDFMVKRNHQYDNNIVIHGLDYIRNSADNVYTFDGRVNVYDTDNPLYLAIVNERKVDAHATALPMDVWLMLRENGTYQEDAPEVDHYTEVTFSIPDQYQNWIQMVLIPREEMEAGINGEKFAAGTGAERYFYTNLLDDIKENSSSVLKGEPFSRGGVTVTDAYFGHHWKVTDPEINEKVEKVTVGDKEYPVGAQCGSKVTVFSTPGEKGGNINNSRSRIYFYIDENVNDPDRTATITVNYKSYKLENDQETDVRTLTRYLDIEQRGLLRVDPTWPGNDGNTTNVNIPETYIEYYEEYLEHSDPLDRHEQEGALYEGLPWGLAGMGLQGKFNNPENNGTKYVMFKEGAFSLTKYIIDNDPGKVGGLENVTLFSSKAPASVFHYCYGKNKRNYDGTPDVGYEGDANNYTAKGWYMPGIRELETALVQYYELYEDFQGHLYWSASLEHGNGHNYAHATKVTITADKKVQFAPSNNETDEGYQSRSNRLRIRAFYRKS